MNTGVYVPREIKETDIPRGAAIVGNPSQGFKVFKPSSNRERFADTLRQSDKFSPALTKIDPDTLILVGYWDSFNGEMRLSSAGARPLSAWIGRSVHRGELEASDSRSNKRQEARQKARRFDMQGRPDLAARERSSHNIGYW
jgi:hypothetical protein